MNEALAGNVVGYTTTGDEEPATKGATTSDVVAKVVGRGRCASNMKRWEERV